MSVDILGTDCDQCRSMVQCCFTSTETVRLIRTESPGRPLRLSHSSRTLFGPSHEPVYIYVHGPSQVAASREHFTLEDVPINSYHTGLVSCNQNVMRLLAVKDLCMSSLCTSRFKRLATRRSNYKLFQRKFCCCCCSLFAYLVRYERSKRRNTEKEGRRGKNPTCKIIW